MDYWEERFASGNWQDKNGPTQTRGFAISQMDHLEIPKAFTGSILDFGCGEGDAFPIYAKSYPKAKLFGADISQSAINSAQKKYGKIARFYQASYDSIKPADIIISSNVFEHLDNDIQIAKSLLSKCYELYIIVPYKELNLCKEHVRSYDETHFDSINPASYKIFKSHGWSHSYKSLLYNVYLKNLFRYLLGKKCLRQQYQIMFHFTNK